MSLHPEIIDGRPGTLVIESFVVDVPEGNTEDETCYFIEALIKCNLKSLADVSEGLAVQDRTEPIDRMQDLLISGWGDSVAMDEASGAFLISEALETDWQMEMVHVFHCYRVAELFIWFDLSIILVIYAGFSL